MADDLAPPSRSLKTQQSERNLNEWRHNVNRNFHRTRSRRVVLTEMSEAQRLEVEEAWGIMLGDSKPASAYMRCWVISIALLSPIPVTQSSR